MEPIKSFKELTAYLTSGQNAKRKKMAVANAVDDHTIEAVMHAVSQGVIEAYLVGDEKIISENPPMIDDYMMNARNNKPYDFKVTNGTNGPIEGIDIYRGMPVGVNGKGQTIYTSARDIGNIAAGYVAGVNGMSWEASRIAFDLYQGGMEGKSTKNAERYGWTMGYNNSGFNQKMDNLLKSVKSIIKSLYNHFSK